jgi:DNA-binding transcriptional LysR family regulator
MRRTQQCARESLADLTTFIAVANSLNFRVAALQFGVTASALSHSMWQLEEGVGTRLLNRTTRSVSLSDAGVRLLERLRPARNSHKLLAHGALSRSAHQLVIDYTNSGAVIVDDATGRSLVTAPA